MVSSVEKVVEASAYLISKKSRMTHESKYIKIKSVQHVECSSSKVDCGVLAAHMQVLAKYYCMIIRSMQARVHT